jgi:hypothetical protein
MPRTRRARQLPAAFATLNRHRRWPAAQRRLQVNMIAPCNSWRRRASAHFDPGSGARTRAPSLRGDGELDADGGATRCRIFFEIDAASIRSNIGEWHRRASRLGHFANATTGPRGQSRRVEGRGARGFRRDLDRRWMACGHDFGRIYLRTAREAAVAVFDSINAANTFPGSSAPRLVGPSRRHAV